MKKTSIFRSSAALLAGALAFFGASVAQAAITAYTFAQDSQTYTPITGGTLHVSGTAGNGNTLDDGAFTAPIGFPFGYDGTNYTNVQVCTNGFLSFGTANPDFLTAAAISNAGQSLVIAGFATDMNGTSDAGDIAELRTETLGSPGSRVFVAQWKNFRHWSTGINVNKYNFQIRLYEGTNVVEIVYGTWTRVAGAATGQVGLKTVLPDFQNRTTTTNWAATTAGVASNATCTVNGTGPILPASGLTFRWSPPPGLTIGSVTQNEGSTGGNTTYGFPITISPAPVTDVTVDWALASVSTNAADFDAGQLTNGTFTFVADGTTTVRNLDVLVQADFSFEPTETFTVTLSNSSGPTILGGGVATGTVTNDDIGICETVLLDEDFSTGTGQTPPTGWSVINDVTNTEPDSWQFSSAATIATVSGPFPVLMDGVHARWDSDVFTTSAFTTRQDLMSPPMDFTAVTGLVQMSYQSLFRFLGATSAIVNYTLDNGTTFVPVRTVTGVNEGNIATGAPATVSVILPASLNGQANVRVSFRWTDPAVWGWYWAVDDALICEMGDIDCNGNTIPDGQDIFNDPTIDCDNNGLIDSCEIADDPSLDCDTDGELDSCEIADDPSLDCDNDSALDSCQIAADPLLDCDENDVLDSCEVGGPGAFYTNDSGTYLDSLGTGAGNADFLALKSFTVVAGGEDLAQMSFHIGGTPSSPVAAVVNGAPVTMVIFDDPNNDGNPTDAVAIDSFVGTVTEANTGNFQVHTWGTPVNVGTAGDRFFVAYAWGTNAANAFFCSLSTGGLGTDSWLAAGPRNGTTATNIASFTSIPPTLLSGIGFERAMIRAQSPNVPTAGDADANGILDECEGPLGVRDWTVIE